MAVYRIGIGMHPNIVQSAEIFAKTFAETIAGIGGNW